MKNQSTALERSEKIREYFFHLLKSAEEEGDIGFTSFKTVFNELMPVQQEKLKAIADTQFESLLREGSLVSIGIAYHDPIIDYIDSALMRKTDYKLWNKYRTDTINSSSSIDLYYFCFQSYWLDIQVIL